MRNKSGNALLLAVGIAIGLSLGLAHGVLADKPAAPGADLPWQDARMLAAVLERVKHDYVNPVDDHQLLQAAIRGMVASLDPYSAYLDGGAGGNSLGRHHCHDRRYPGKYQYFGGHHWAHARRGRHSGQDRHHAR